MKEATETQTQTAIRLSDSLLARIDKLAERMSRPGIRITRADVIRLAVTQGTAALEAESKKKR